MSSEKIPVEQLTELEAAAELAALALSLVIHFNIKKVIIAKAPVEEKTSVKVEET